MIPTRTAALAQSGNRFSDEIMTNRDGNIICRTNRHRKN
jgi:hypothetical protein